MQPRWQILVPTLDNPNRRRLLERLMTDLRPQLTERVGVLTLADDGAASIGKKRQSLLEKATAPFVSMFDDDDLPAPDYVSRILEVIDGADPPDVVGFKLRYYVDGRECGTAVHSYNAAAVSIGPHWASRWRRFNRLPNHLNPVRRALAVAVGYKPLNVGEDSDYARRLAEMNPREQFIDAPLYSYLYRRNRDGEETNQSRKEDCEGLRHV